MAAPQKRILQATFDDAVKENQETFGMPLEEAIADAITQFTSAGVDLTNIVKDGSTLLAAPPASDKPSEVPAGDTATPAAAAPAKQHPVLASISTLQKFVLMEDAVRFQDDAVVQQLTAALKTLADECAKSPEHRAIAGSNVAVTHACTAIRQILEQLDTIVADSPSSSLTESKRAEGSTTVVDVPLLQQAVVAAMHALRCMCIGDDENRGRVPLTTVSLALRCMQPIQPPDVQKYVSALPHLGALREADAHVHCPLQGCHAVGCAARGAPRGRQSAPV